MKSTCPLILTLLLLLITASGSPAITPERETKSLSPLLEPASSQPVDTKDGVTDYHTYTEVVVELNQVVSDHSSIVALTSIGNTYQGRGIWALKISDNPQIEEDEPEVYFNCLHHAREWLATEVCLYIIKTLTGGYGVNQTITDIVDQRQVWIIPMVNPDGRAFDGGDDPRSYTNWRKNRSPNWDGTFGTDLNRNYDYMWGGAGASDQPRSQTYRGPGPFSETESSSIRDFVAQHNFVFSISYHSFSQLILYPWGNTVNTTEDNLLFSTLANEMSNRITNKAGSAHPGYTPQKGSDLYITSGTDDDWLYAEMGIYAFTIELYPDQRDISLALWPPYNRFHPREDKILPVCEDNIGAALYLLEIADNPFQVIDHVSLSTTEERSTIPRGQWGNFDVTVLNDGKNADVYDLTSSHISNWLIALDKNQVTLSPNRSSQLSLSVQVPHWAAPGKHYIWVNATSTVYPGVSDSIRLEVNVPYYHDVGVVQMGYFDHGEIYPMGNYSFTSVIENSGESPEFPFDTSVEIRRLGPPIPQVMLTEGAESVNPSWTVIDYDGTGSNNEWHRVSTQSHNGSYSWWIGNDATGRYSNRAYQILMSPPFSLEGATRATLHFYQKLKTEEGYDFAAIDVGLGGTWKVLASYSGPVSFFFQKFTFDISDFIDEKDIQIRFRFSSDEGITDAGWYLDDIVVIGEFPQEVVIYGPEIRIGSTILNPGEVETIDWIYKFREGGTFKIVAQTLLSTDQNVENNQAHVVIAIDPSKYRIPLKEGWNLISLPLVPASNDLSTILSPISGKYTVVRYYCSNSIADPWKEYSPWKRYFDLGEANETMALWIEASEDVDFDLQGTVAPATTIRMFAGWNFVGYSSLTERRVSDALAGLPVVKVQTYDSSPPFYLREMSPNEYFRTGSGYWLLVSQDVDWIVYP
ncbi:MAG: M14 family zinc carboxypeptidase [Thermoplasmata archaeon]